jgi:acyl-lipid omega-3 desaturase
MFHNHIEKDYSYGWFTEDVLKQPTEKLSRSFDNNPILKGFLPFYGWFMYLLGVNDGSHFLPIKSHRLWQQTPRIESLKCLLSTAVAIGFGIGHYFLYGQNIMSWLFYYGAPLIMFGWWLVTVTYLQHHHEDSIVYNDDDWKFMEAAFETVDRQYGWGIDSMNHHITDGHVAHHLFYTLIPHYNLPIATAAIKKFLQEKNAMHLYRFEDTRLFPWTVHRTLIKHGLRARRATPTPALVTATSN